jgi:hypothetical protein
MKLTARELSVCTCISLHLQVIVQLRIPLLPAFELHFSAAIKYHNAHVERSATATLAAT